MLECFDTDVGSKGVFMMAKLGDKVQIHYTGTLDNGEQFDTSVGQEPLEFILGKGQVIPGFEDAVMGMELGEKKTVLIPATEAYGNYDEQLVFEISREQLPAMDVEVGMQLSMEQPSGHSIPVTIIDVSDTGIVIDANHPLAGEALTFELELVSIH
jgi:peptidylprolyl isomerase